MYVFVLKINIINGNYLHLFILLAIQVFILILFLVLTTITYLAQVGPTIQCIMIYGMLAVSVYNYFSYTTKVSRQMANILGIRIFHIKPQL